MKKKENENKKKFEAFKEEIQNQFNKEKKEIASKFGLIIDAQNEQINAQNTKIALLAEINHQSEIHSQEMNKYILNLGTKFNYLLNTCKVLFIRKICDFIIEGLIKRYRSSMTVTKFYSINNAKTKFQLIVFHEDVAGNSKYYLNTIIDFLMETIQYCSSIVHMKKKV